MVVLPFQLYIRIDKRKTMEFCKDERKTFWVRGISKNSPLKLVYEFVPTITGWEQRCATKGFNNAYVSHETRLELLDWLQYDFDSYAILNIQPKYE